MLVAATDAVRFQDLLYTLPTNGPATSAQWQAVLHKAEASDLAAVWVIQHVRVPFWQQQQAARLSFFRTDYANLIALGLHLPVAPPPTTTTTPVSPTVTFTGDQTMLSSFKLDDGNCCPGYRRALWTTTVPANATLVVRNSKGSVVETLQASGKGDPSAALTWITPTNQLAYGSSPAPPGTYAVTLTFVAIPAPGNPPSSRTVTAQWTAVVSQPG